MIQKLIDAYELKREMYRRCVDTDIEINKGRAKWDSGLWIRYKVFEDAIKVASRVDAEPRWIPVTERLPDGRLNKSYLVQDKDGRRAIGTYTNLGWMFTNYMNDTVAWMPLPEPYKGGAEE